MPVKKAYFLLIKKNKTKQKIKRMSAKLIFFLLCLALLVSTITATPLSSKISNTSGMKPTPSTWPTAVLSEAPVKGTTPA